MAQQTAAGLWSALTAAGYGDSFQLQTGNSVLLASIVTSIAGTSPSLTVYLDVLNVSGSWIQVGALPAQTATGTQFAAVTPASVESDLTHSARLRWSLSGSGAIVGAAVTVVQS